MLSLSSMQDELQKRPDLEMTSGVSNGNYQRNAKQMVNAFRTDRVSVTKGSIDVKVFGFLTVPADAKCGVCAHEIGHLGTQQPANQENSIMRITLTNSSIWLAGSV